MSSSSVFLVKKTILQTLSISFVKELPIRLSLSFSNCTSVTVILVYLILCLSTSNLLVFYLSSVRLGSRGNSTFSNAVPLIVQRMYVSASSPPSRFTDVKAIVSRQYQVGYSTFFLFMRDVVHVLDLRLSHLLKHLFI